MTEGAFFRLLQEAPLTKKGHKAKNLWAFLFPYLYKNFHDNTIYNFNHKKSTKSPNTKIAANSG
jgi:hypothetical protein